jgi:hypothetical protein
MKVRRNVKVAYPHSNLRAKYRRRPPQTPSTRRWPALSLVVEKCELELAIARGKIAAATDSAAKPFF